MHARQHIRPAAVGQFAEDRRPPRAEPLHPLHRDRWVFEVRVMRLVLMVAVAIALCACAGYPFARSPSPGNPVASSPGVAHHAVVVTEQDRTAAVRVGQTLLLELHALPGMTDWNGVT